MSQHHLTVKNTLGHTIKLVAGWDWPLHQFFLTMRDARLPAEEYLPDGEETQIDFQEVVNYDSQATLEGLRGFRSIGDIEDQLWKHKIPFVPADKDASCINPKLLPLVCELLNEKDGPRPALDQKRKNWDLEPEPVEEPEHPDAKEWARQYGYDWKKQDPHPIYSYENFITFTAEYINGHLMMYDMWVRQLLSEMANRDVLLK